jgi:5-methylcytosine-specific restriction endonuclease McrA
MSWANHGKWHIDHIIPLKYPGKNGGPPTLEDVKARLDYRNTQALWAHDNIAKGNRWIGGAVRPDEPVMEIEHDDINELVTFAMSNTGVNKIYTDAELDEFCDDLINEF